MNRSRVRASSVGALLATSLVATVPALAAPPPTATATASFWYAGTRLTFEHPQLRAGALAVASDDPGLGRFLAKLGATLEYRPGQSAITIANGERKPVSMSVGDARYNVDGASQTASFAPYVANGAVFLPFLDVARALHVEAVEDGLSTVLQPKIAALDVRTLGRVTTLVFHGASPLRVRRLAEGGDELSVVFMGIGSTLDAQRTLASTAVRNVSVVTTGSVKNPTTVVTFAVPVGGTHALMPSDSPYAVTLAFAPAGTVLGGVPIPSGAAATVAMPPPAPPLAPTPPPVALAPTSPGPTLAPTPVQVTDFATDDVPDGLRVHLKLSGDVGYEWHRLPDNRWYLDLKPAILAVPTQETPLQNGAVASLRMKSFLGPNDRVPTVRLAFTLASPRLVSVDAEPGGLAIAVDPSDDTSGQRVGAGSFGNGRIVAATLGAAPASAATPLVVPLATPYPLSDVTPAPSWKFSSAPPAAGNNKLVVIDPGHGGSDAGAARNGLTEKDLNLDLSKRLRGLLVARGWQVKLTRENDVDVFAPNDSAHDELQARCDVANAAGARLFVSMHTNSFTSSSLNGTTTYYYTPASYGLAQAVHARFAATLPTKDDGIRKENFYVIHHASMPSILIETAFLSNAGDAQFLRSPDFMQKVATAIADGIGDYAAAPPSAVSSTSADDR
ncbi:MAG: hypothetical protein NVSMB21_06520 [Vulcanimicrobiaceae bacterium]